MSDGKQDRKEMDPRAFRMLSYSEFMARCDVASTSDLEFRAVDHLDSGRAVWTHVCIIMRDMYMRSMVDCIRQGNVADLNTLLRFMQLSPVRDQPMSFWWSLLDVAMDSTATSKTTAVPFLCEQVRRHLEVQASWTKSQHERSLREVLQKPTSKSTSIETVASTPVDADVIASTPVTSVVVETVNPRRCCTNRKCVEI
jgi:hypothetical protein